MTEPGRVLIVDDSEATLEVIRRHLEGVGHAVRVAAAVRVAVEILTEQPFDLVVTDIKMPEVSGLDLVRHVRENYKDTEVLVVTGYPSVGGAVDAMKTGAVDYLTKPFTESELFEAVARALDRLALRKSAPADAGLVPLPSGILGDSRALQRVVAQVDRVSRTQAPVLISGESGTGKELVARAIHYQSARAGAPFVAINCGGIPNDLIESELFGHVQGAYTGATRARAGFFLTADGGTIFLDEISETSLAMQVKLLRVLQEGEVYMVGSSRPRSVDVRILAATNKDLGQMVEKGTFREDLFFRVNVINIAVPPLRERGNDVVELARHFARRYAAEMGRSAPRFSERALGVLRSYAWPGNVRELQNVVQRLIVMLDGDVADVADLPASMRFAASRSRPLDLRRPLVQVEAEYIREVLSSVGGNKTEAAQILGIDRKTLRARIRAAERAAGSAGDEDAP